MLDKASIEEAVGILVTGFVDTLNEFLQRGFPASVYYTRDRKRIVDLRAEIERLPLSEEQKELLRNTDVRRHVLELAFYENEFVIEYTLKPINPFRYPLAVRIDDDAIKLFYAHANIAYDERVIGTYHVPYAETLFSSALAAFTVYSLIMLL